MIQPLHATIQENPTSAGVSFLEVKLHTMLNYIMNVCYYLVMKAEGRSISQHPVIQHLVEMRVYMEKMNPLENKLKYQIDKLLRTATNGGSDSKKEKVEEGEEEHEQDAMSFRPNLAGMANKR